MQITNKGVNYANTRAKAKNYLKGYDKVCQSIVRKRVTYEDVAKEEGIAIGEERGRQEGANKEKRRMAISLLDLLGNGDIANTTGLSLKEIQQLRRDAKKNN